MMKIALSAAGYIVIVFPLAYVWHLVFFKEKYQMFGYFSGTPNVPLGLMSIVIQSLVLAVFYPLFKGVGSGFLNAFQFVGLIGTFFWTSHVLALVAKQNVPNAGGFIAMETLYLGLQFGLFGVLLGVIYRS